jgi:hypothetical protein
MIGPFFNQQDESISVLFITNCTIKVEVFQSTSSYVRELNSLRGIDSKLSQLSGIKYTKLKVEQRLPDSNCLATLGGTSDRLQVYFRHFNTLSSMLHLEPIERMKMKVRTL